MVFFHPERKTNSEDWAAMVDKGGLAKALRAINPKHKRGAWKIICDNESFLTAPESRAAHKEARVRLIEI